MPHENQTTPPESDMTRQPLRQASSDGGDMLAEFNAAVLRKQQELAAAPEPTHIRTAVRKIVQALPEKPLTPEELEALERRRAEAALRQQQQERRTRWQSLASGRGKRYANCTLADYRVECQAQAEAIEAICEYSSDMAFRCQIGEGVLLFGPVGTGKDHILAALMRLAILEHGFTVRWENGMDLFGAIRDRMDSGDPEKSLVDSLTYPDILVVSDPLPPKGELTTHQSAMLFRVIDSRYSRDKPTWVSFNAANRLDAENRMGVPLVDRLSHGALVVFTDWPSYRKAR